MHSTDTLVLDRPGAVHLWSVMAATTEALMWDRIATGTLIDEASVLLGRPAPDPALSLRRAHEGLGRLAVDLRSRLDQIDSLWADVERIDVLSGDISDWHGTDNDPILDRYLAERRARVLEFLGGDMAATLLVLRHLDDGSALAEAIGMAEQHLFDLRVEEVVGSLGVSVVEAEDRVREINLKLAILTAHGYGAAEAAVGVSLAVTFDIDIEAAVALAVEHGAALVDAIAWMTTSQGLGITVPELLALDGLTRHFGALDNATGGDRDDKVGVDDLLHVVEHPWRFADGVVLAAQAMLDNHQLRARLDSAAGNNDVLVGDGFGSREPADRVISLTDLQTFMVKAQINTVLGEFAAQIDVAADASGNPDGFYSRADFERFIDDNPQLPPEVRAGAQTMLAAGWFDRTWMEQHRDELALGAAVLAGGVVIIVTAGAGTPLVVAAGAAAGATAAGTTTLAINMTGDAAGAWEGLTANTIGGGMIGFSVAGLPASLSAIGGTSGMARMAAVAGTTSEGTGVVASGGIDLVLPDGWEDGMHTAAGRISQVTGAVNLGYGAVRSSSSQMTTYESVDDQLDALSATVSRQRQNRHLEGSDMWADVPRSYMVSADDAQEVLDAVRDGNATILGRTPRGHLRVEYDGVTGVDLNLRLEPSVAPVNTFLIKGTAAPSVVPTRTEAIVPE